MPVVAPAPARATIAIDTVPVGAEVVGADGVVIGKTPLRFELLRSADPVTIEIRLAGYRTLTRELIVSGDQSLQIDLEHGPNAPHGAHPAHGRDSGSDTLMRPGDL
jgi:PEGA domain-containing protein